MRAPLRQSAVEIMEESGREGLLDDKNWSTESIPVPLLPLQQVSHSLLLCNQSEATRE